MKEKDEVFEGLKADVYAGSISYDDISKLQKKGIINKGQATYLRRLWNEKWNKKTQTQYISDVSEEELYEKVFHPTEIRIEELENGEERIIISDKLGKKLTITSKLAIDRLYGLLYRRLGLTYKQLRHKPLKERESLVNHGVRTRKRPLKFIFKNGEIVSIATPTHRMFNWKQVRQIIDEAIREVYGETEVVKLGENYNYRIPVKNKYVSAWLNVNPGNNVVDGRSAIRLNTRFRTEFDTASGGARPPCMNWANLWQVPIKLFNVQRWYRDG